MTQYLHKLSEHFQDKTPQIPYFKAYSGQEKVFSTFP